jgi:uncharacterized protein with HEPN domain
MQPEVAKLLRDILEAGKSVQQFVAGVSFDDYEQSLMMRMAVERQMITVGEALNNALQQDPTLRERITAAREIVAFRHILVHAYSIIDDDRVWGALVSKLPLLLAEVRALLPPAP